MTGEFNCLEHCPDLGHCCRDFSIGNEDRLINRSDKYEDVVKWIESNKVPFKALGFNDENGMWRFTCKNLGSDGRCTDYENRPELCRNFRPRSESLCCVPRLTIGEYFRNLTFSLVMKIKMIGVIIPLA